jgi:MoaA/NifB/PqqE/SkfB family radical SAM enzyme
LCSYWRAKPVKYLRLFFIREKVVPLIRNYRVEVTFISGGEPTLHPEIVDIIKDIYKTGTSITLITNGAGLNRVFDQLKSCVNAYIFSLDAAGKELHSSTRGLDNFAELISWPKRIKAANPAAQVAFACLLQKENIEDIVNLYCLLSAINCDAIFFNVPEMKPQCFGRGSSFPKELKKYALLNDQDLNTLEINLEKIQDLDYLKGKLHQSEEFFDDCVQYFRFLREESVEFRDRICSMPFSSLVIDEAGNISPCFYLPFSMPFAASAGQTGQKGGLSEPDKEKDIVNFDYLKSIREEIRNNKKFRATYCRHCMQFLG